MRISLGAGEKKLEGYIGVDIHPGADVQADILELPQAWEGKADELLVVHAFEHLAFYQAQPALREWKRVLKSGGKLAIESPNLKSACLAYINDPSNVAYGLWPLYGDQSRGDIFTVHKSGWTPESLIAELERAGFINCTKAPAQFKKREPRDFRVEAWKP